MIFHSLGLRNKDQRGFTIIELLVALAITCLITGGVTMAIFQVFAGNARTSNHMTAVRQVQNAGYWIGRDAQMAQTVDTGVFSGCPLTLGWTEYGVDGDVHQVVYALVDSQLRRSHSVNSGEPVETLVAQYIDSTGTDCQFAGGKVTLTVMATVGGFPEETSETRVYEVIPRPDPQYPELVKWGG